MFPDGEYEITADSFNTESDTIAIRHGFVPDSMNTSAPQRFYRDGSRCILIAQPAVAANDPIYFEGKSLDVSKQGEGFYLSLDCRSPSRITLHKLSSSFRFAKARSVSALSTRVDTLEADSRKRRASSNVQRPVLAPSPQKLGAAQILISDSDFDDLNSDLDESKFPQFPVIENNVGLNSSFNTDRQTVTTITEDTLHNGNQTVAGSRSLSALGPESMPDDVRKVAKPTPMSPEKYMVKGAATPNLRSLNSSNSAASPQNITKQRQLSRPIVIKEVPPSHAAKSAPSSKLKKQSTAPSSPPIDDDFADLEDELHKVLESADTDTGPEPHIRGNQSRSYNVSREESSSEED